MSEPLDNDPGFAAKADQVIAEMSEYARILGEYRTKLVREDFAPHEVLALVRDAQAVLFGVRKDDDA